MLKVNPIYGHHMIMMLLVVHLIIGHRRLRDVDSYRARWITYRSRPESATNYTCSSAFLLTT